MSTITQQVEAVLEQVRPALEADGGNVRLVSVDVETGVVMVAFEGACQHCPLSRMTLKLGIEAAIRDALPSITRVEAQSIPLVSSL